MGFGFLGQQGLAVLRTLVLARLLTPEDFGLVGIVMLTLFAGLVLTEWGIESALIQRSELSPGAIDVAWSLTVFRGSGLFLLAQICAPWIAIAFKRPDAESLLRIGAISFLLVNVQAVSASLLLREMRFRDRAILDAGRDLIGAVAAITLALWWGNAWALILSLLLSQMVGAVAVWFMHGFRPRWSLDLVELAEYWRFGRHLYTSGLLTYVVTRGDDITVGKLRGLSELGQYQVVFGIAETLTRGFGDIVGKVVFPAYSHMSSQGRTLTEAFQEVWYIHLLFLLPIASTLMAFPFEIVSLLLGAQWFLAAVPFAILVFAETLRALTATFGTLILAAGRTRYLFRIKLIEALLFGALIVPMTARWGMTGAASCLMLVYCVSLGAAAFGAQQVEPVVARVLACSWEPVITAAILSLLAWALTVGLHVPTAIGILTWAALWSGYIWLRHWGLLIMLWAAATASFAPADSKRTG